MIEMTEVELEIDEEVFNAVYVPYLHLDTRNQIFFGGSASGKSYFLAQRCVLDIIQGERNYLIVRNVQRTQRNSTFNEICKAINFLEVRKFFKINKSDMAITSVTGNQILFCGLDDPEKLKSITPIQGIITDIWVEEATEVNYQAVKQLEKRLRGQSIGNKRIIFSFNPILKDHWLYQTYFKGWQDGKNIYQEDNVFILKTTYKDNKFLLADDINALENETDKYYYDVYTLGNWGVLGAVIFKNWRVEDLTKIREIADKFKNGLDFGFAKDPAALVHTYYDRKRKTIYILDELYMTDLTNDILAKKVKEIINNQVVVCDSAEPKSIRELNRYGINALPAKKGKDSINHGIQWLQQQTIVIDVNCQNTKNEFQKYKWKEDKNGNVLSVPVDRENHLLDSLRYAYEDEFLNYGEEVISGSCDY